MPHPYHVWPSGTLPTCSSATAVPASSSCAGAGRQCGHLPSGNVSNSSSGRSSNVRGHLHSSGKSSRGRRGALRSSSGTAVEQQRGSGADTAGPSLSHWQTDDLTTFTTCVALCRESPQAKTEMIAKVWGCPDYHGHAFGWPIRLIWNTHARKCHVSMGGCALRAPIEQASP